MRFKKRAQTATEYLIILAVVIVIALVVASLLGGFPGIGGNIGSGASDSYWLAQDVAIVGSKITVDTTTNMINVSLKIKNNMPNTVTVQQLGLNTTTANVSVNRVLATGEEYTVNIYNAVVGTGTAAGSTVSYPVSIYYQDNMNANHNQTTDRDYSTKVASS